MSWCDKLASTPSVGVFLVPVYTTSEDILAVLGDKMTSWAVGKKTVPFQITEQDTFSVTIQHDDGFAYHFDPGRVNVTFQHRIRLSPSSAGPPVAQLISRPEPFTELLADASELLVDMLLLLPDGGRRQVTQIGVVSNTTVDPKDLPPGLKKFGESLGRPWGNCVTTLAASVTAKVGQNDRSSDQCIHRINMPDPESGELTNLVFDYQRHYSKPAKIAANSLKKDISATTADALKYLETLAEGDIFDVDSGSTA